MPLVRWSGSVELWREGTKPTIPGKYLSNQDDLCKIMVFSNIILNTVLHPIRLATLKSTMGTGRRDGSGRERLI